MNARPASKNGLTRAVLEKNESLQMITLSLLSAVQVMSMIENLRTIMRARGDTVLSVIKAESAALKGVVKGVLIEVVTEVVIEAANKAAREAVIETATEAVIEALIKAVKEAVIEAETEAEKEAVIEAVIEAAKEAVTRAAKGAMRKAVREAVRGAVRGEAKGAQKIDPQHVIKKKMETLMPANRHVTVTTVGTVTAEGHVHPATTSATTVTSQVARGVSCVEGVAALALLPAHVAHEAHGVEDHQEATSGVEIREMIVVVAILTSPTLRSTSLVFRDQPGVKKSKISLPKMVLKLAKS